MRIIEEGVRELNLTVGAAQLEQLSRFVGLLSKWNKAYNLTAIEKEEDIAVKHILDSLAIAPFIDGDKVIDVGTGGGLPGIPLAICFPEKQWTLVDANSKKVRFLRQAVYELGLNNVSPVHARAEEMMQDGYDIIVCRAFASLQQIVGYTASFMGAATKVLAMKGALSDEEMGHVPVGYEVCAIHGLTVPFLDASRHLVSLKRLSS